MSIHDFLRVQTCLTPLIIAAGLLVRGRLAFARTFCCYLIVTGSYVGLDLLWPEVVGEYSFYSAMQTLLFALKILVAVEVWLRVFAPFPRARVRVGLLLLVPLVSTAVAVYTVPPMAYPYDLLVGIIYPRQQAGILAVYAVFVAAAWWYRVPLHPLYRAILVGFAAYLSVTVLCGSVMGSQAGNERVFHVVKFLDASTFSLTLIWWAWAAWRPVKAPSAVVARLQPWAHSW